MRLNPETYSNITPTDFEKYVKSLFERFDSQIKHFEVSHNVREKTNDGEFQIDIKITFDFLGADYITLVECKRHKTPIKREVVQILKDKIERIGAHKGILVSTSDFQKGALDYSKIHGIALANIVDGKLTYSVKSHDKVNIQIPDWVNLPKYCFFWINEIQENSYGRTNLVSDYIKDFEKIMFKRQ